MSLISYLFPTAAMSSPSHGRDMAVEVTEVTMSILILQVYMSHSINF